MTQPNSWKTFEEWWPTVGGTYKPTLHVKAAWEACAESSSIAHEAEMAILGNQLVKAKEEIEDIKRLREATQEYLNDHRDCLEDIRHRLKGHPDSRLDGDHGLAAATMQGFEGMTIEIDEYEAEMAKIGNNLVKAKEEIEDLRSYIEYQEEVINKNGYSMPPKQTEI